MAERQPLKTRKVLVIDDDRDIVQTIKGNLVLDGYEVLEAFDARSGIALVKKIRPDLVILDLNLPDLDGIKACEILRREFDVPIIMLSARDGVSDKVLGLQCGADDYMVKPFNYLELSARIKSVFNRLERSMVTGARRFGDLEVDFKQKSVLASGRPVRLTRTEFELLELFVSFPGEVLTRDFIQQQVWWDSRLYTHSRALDVHVQRLRKKIEPRPETPRYIVTVAGVGYRFEPVTEG
jgi:two-component system alkaline phosphatase synthesis response regulator PhoP/OmpR family response regulator RpaB